jgi:UDP-N-acetylmuramoyl-L-alanyl-D-glutamate--2,6-diaminopimelate ligase
MATAPVYPEGQSQENPQRPDALRRNTVRIKSRMHLHDLLDGVALVAGLPGADPAVPSIAYDSRHVERGALFVAMRGEKTDGNNFVASAVERGAAAIASEAPRPADLPGAVAWIQVRDARKALALISANSLGRPADALKLVGITGTNGKTTTAFVVDSILRAAGHQTGLFGTIEYRTPYGARPASHTTPESLELQRFLADVRDAGGTHAAFEVSSHALALDRVWGCQFAAAVFTNLTRDHLDFHKTFDEYFAAKKKLFAGTGKGAPAVAVVNSDDPCGKQLAGMAPRTLTYGIHNGADINARKFALTFAGLEFTAQTPAGKIEVRSPLVGRINVYNILGAIGAGLALGLPNPTIERGIAALDAVPGRFQRMDEGQPFLVIVDYAHTDDALRNLIETARELNKSGRILTLFGCGGDRDRAKRPLMGEAAGSLSHRVVLTSDNPRTEDPLRIINDVVVGLQKAKADYVVEPDRARAIELLLGEARPGDIVLLAGKGHETYQILQDRTIDFDDRAMARATLRALGFSK